MKPSGALRASLWVGGALAAIALSSWARHAWVQASGMSTACETNPLVWPCPARQAVIQAFINHRLSTLALALAAAAALLQWWGSAATAARWAQGLAWLGLCVAACGLVLYDTERSAVAFLLCALLGLRAGWPAEPR